MGETRPERIVLELDPGDPISGRICGPTGRSESFRGWLELTSRIERLRPAVRVDLANSAASTATEPVSHQGRP